MTLAGGNAFAAWNELNLPVGVTPISRAVYDLHMLMLWICVIIGIIVFGAMFVSILLHRKAAGHAPAQFHHSTLAEILWTVIPIVILVCFAVPATRTLIDMEDTSEADLTLKVTGYQWLWKYEYVEDGVSFYSSLAPSVSGGAKVDHGSGGTVPLRRSKTLPVCEPFPVTGRGGGCIPWSCIARSVWRAGTG